MIKLSQSVLSQLVGHLLGDGHMRQYPKSRNFAFEWAQTIKRFEYSWQVYNNLSHYCNSFLKLKYTLSFGQKNPKLCINTRALPCLNFLHELFFIQNSTGKYVKYINPQLLMYLTPEALAYWAIDDGHWQQNGFVYNVQSFTFNEAYLLAGMLHYLYDLECSVWNDNSKPRLYIKAKSISSF